VVARHAGELRTEANPLVEVITSFFDAAQRRGQLRDDVTPFELTALFLPGTYGLLQMKLANPPAELRRGLYRGIDIFVRGITP
jgi:hypothetical protein